MFSDAAFSARPFSSTADVLLWSYTTDGADVAVANIMVAYMVSSATTDGADVAAAYVQPKWIDIPTGTASWQLIAEGTSNSWTDVNSSSPAVWQPIVA